MAKKKAENLVQIVKAGFKRVDEQFKHVDEQFKHVDGRFKLADEKLERQIENLARMTEHGFAEARKQADERFKLILDRFHKVEADITDIKRALGPIVQMLATTDREMADLELRLRRVERKVGLVS